MKNCDTLIIGAGAAGLMAAYKLSVAGQSVIVLEARGRLGGRIHTLQNELFFKQAEQGAEFVHGNLPITLGLMKTAGIKVQPASGEMWRYENGKFKTDDDAMPDWGILLERLEHLREDCSIEAFLQREFADEKYKELCKAVRKFVAGYDTADPNEASAFALRREWQHEGENDQPRVKGGYISLINFMANECKRHGVQINSNSAVTDIYHEVGKAQVRTANGDVYYARQLLMALPLGVLQAQGGEGTVKFHPPIPQYQQALNNIGFGAIIKILLEFNKMFWESDEIAEIAGKDPKDMGFVLSDQPVPTWWTQHPERSHVLTGWLGGPPAAAMQHASEEELLDLALNSLAKIFNKDTKFLTDNLVAFNCANWTTDPYTRGSYAYDKVSSPSACKILCEPVENTVYFAGEYLYQGAAMGTVEAALSSGNEAAQKIIITNKLMG